MALTPKQEAFAQAVVAGANQSDAYRAAYDTGRMKATSINVNASKLMSDAKVAQRVAALRKPAAEAAQYGLKEAMLEAADALAVSKSKQNGGAMVAAVALRAKLCGLIIEKRQNVPNPFEEVPIHELEAMDAALTAIKNARSTDKSSA